MRTASLVLALLVVAAPMCCLAQDSPDTSDGSALEAQADKEVKAEIESDESKEVMSAIATKTERVEEAQKQRSDARKMLRKANKPIPKILQKGALVDMLANTDQATVMHEIEVAKNKTIIDAKVRGVVQTETQRVKQARQSREAARQALKAEGKPIPYVLKKGNLEKLMAVKDKEQIVKHIQEHDLFNHAHIHGDDMTTAATDTLAAVLDEAGTAGIADTETAKEEFAEGVDPALIKKAKYLRAKAREHYMAENKPIPYVLQSGSLSKMMKWKDKDVVQKHISEMRAALTKEANAETAAASYKLTKEKRVAARVELTKKGEKIPYVLAKKYFGCHAEPQGQGARTRLERDQNPER